MHKQVVSIVGNIRNKKELNMNCLNKIVTFLFFLIINSNLYSQSITFLDNQIRIGDSIDDVFKKIDSTHFDIETSFEDTGKPACKIKTLSFFNKSPTNYKYYGDLVFGGCNWPQVEAISYSLLRVKKNWLTIFDNETNISKIFGIISDIISKSGIDNYDYSIENEIVIEPDDISKGVTIKLNDWHSVNFRTRNDYYEIAEIITRDELNNIRHKYFYTIIFFDEYDYYKFPNRMGIERFDDEEEAQRRLRELRIPYILNHRDEKKWGRILRFAEDYKYEFKFDNKEHK